MVDGCCGCGLDDFEVEKALLSKPFNDGGEKMTIGARIRQLVQYADGLSSAVGASTSAIVDGGAAGTLSSKLRRISADVASVLGVAGAGTDAPVVEVEGAGGRSVVSLLKGIKNYLHTMVRGADTASVVSGSVNSSGDNQLVAAPSAGSRLVVSYFSAQLEEAGPVTMNFRAGTTDVYRMYAAAAGDFPLTRVFAPGREWRLPEATALNLNLSAAKACGYVVEYWTEVI